MEKITTCIALFCLVAISIAPAAEGLTCGQVVGAVRPCILYLTRNVPLPSACCRGIRSALGQAKTTPDRRTACNCLKNSARAFSINQRKASGLPGRCGVRIGYPISPNVDCSKVR